MTDELELLRDMGRDYTDRSEASMARARTLLQRRIEAEETRRRRRWRPLHPRFAIVGVVAALLGSGFGFGLGTWNTEEGSARTSVGLGFLPAKGWTVLQSIAVGQGDVANAVAANVPLRPGDDPRAAVRATRASLPDHGILIFATFTARGDPAKADFARRELPLTLERAGVVERLRASIGTYNVDVRIYFGSGSPSAQTIEAAQRQLNRLVVTSERVTIFARPTLLGRGQTLMLFGSADTGRADEVVTIEAKDCGQSSFQGIAAVRTREGGGWSTEFVNPGVLNRGVTATFRAVWNDHKSTPITVQARAQVQLRRRGGSSSRFSVFVSGRAQFWRRQIVIERFDRRNGSWKAIKKVVLTRTASHPGSPSVSSYEDFRLAVPKGTLIRAFFPLSQARPCYLAGYSQLVRT
jgi:hypothetical protein